MSTSTFLRTACGWRFWATQLLALVLLVNASYAQYPAISGATLLRNSYRVFEQSRTANGLYLDHLRFDGSKTGIPVSTASTGMALVAICVARDKGWITSDATAQGLINQTLGTIMNPAGSTFRLDRNPNGYPRHFVDPVTGAQAWGSEYSSIDAAILVSGALFAKTRFPNDANMTSLVDRLYNSIDWAKSVVVTNGTPTGLYRNMAPGGDGQVGTETTPWNEYMLLAYLAFKASNGNTMAPGYRLWNNVYTKPGSSGLITRKGYYDTAGQATYTVLSDNNAYYLSSFIPQFCFYLNNYYNTNTTYRNYFTAAKNADYAWFNNSTPNRTRRYYEWGLGAGSSNLPNMNGYHADAINNNGNYFVSPHIVAGFAPVAGSAASDLNQMSIERGEARYTLPGTSHVILWRYSINYPGYRAPEVQLVDFSTMLFGLAANDAAIGVTYFRTYTNFNMGNWAWAAARPALTTTTTPASAAQPVQVYPSMATDVVRVDGTACAAAQGTVRVVNVTGQQVYTATISNRTVHTIDVSGLRAGVYFVKYSSEAGSSVSRIVVQ